ncbi:hypothetical protein CTAYLR_001494 [Chrysophaeum taylorii]|uniref:Peroxisomal membrane protein n=1 Tax=Chrysophaeum taylorii TaxID=2483200 RepID=A0AAD7XKI4_9STRA|nr:hypothetical protein CTAYLR_001494 [Chrysophaeum taylorii]
MDVRRVAVLTSFNALYVGAVLHYLYRLFPPLVVAVGRRLNSQRLRDPSTTVHAFGCSLVDNVHCGTIYIPTYFVYVGTLEGNIDEAAATLRREWWPTYASCTLFWVPYSWCNFALAPPSARVRITAVGNFVWSIFVDWIAHRGPFRAS